MYLLLDARTRSFINYGEWGNYILSNHKGGCAVDCTKHKSGLLKSRF